MSVPEGKRGLSEMEFYRTANRLRRDMTLLLLRDFGIKDKVRDVELLCRIHGLDPNDKAALKEIMEKYGIGEKITEKYPEWLIDKMRSSIMDILRDLMLNIRAANSIYPVNIAEYEERRLFQDKAICSCEQLYEEMQYVISVVPVDAQKYMPYVGEIEKEIALLKGWRKGDNRMLKRIKHL